MSFQNIDDTIILEVASVVRAGFKQEKPGSLMVQQAPG